MIKAIETVYNGYRFRSRLEARWAVFFDTLGIPYEYEKEGYDLDGEWYLPDFWLPSLECWVEIKPSMDGVGYSKFYRLADGTGHDVVVLIGSEFEPYRQSEDQLPMGTRALVFGPNTPDRDEHKAVIGWWAECVTCLLAAMVPDQITVDEAGLSAHYHETPETAARSFVAVVWTAPWNVHRTEEKHSIGHSLSPRLDRAYTAARQARFEHGEHGRA